MNSNNVTDWHAQILEIYSIIVTEWRAQVYEMYSMVVTDWGAQVYDLYSIIITDWSVLSIWIVLYYFYWLACPVIRNVLYFR